MEYETIRFESSDGAGLVGDVVVPARPRAAAIVCHPHPQFGGDRFNPVVDALFTRLGASDVAALRFDFRAEFDDGHGERHDAEAALAEIRRRAPGLPAFATGYSFGATVVLALSGDGLAGKVLVAPPFGHIGADARAETTPCLVLTPAHDQFAPPATAGPIVRTWADGEFEVIESVDHFMTGAASVAADRAQAWIDRRLRRRSRRRSPPSPRR